MKLHIHENLKQHLPNENTFDYVMSLRGKVYRELENRRTQYLEIAGQGYFLKQHFGIGWKEFFKNIFQGRFPVLGAQNEWRAVQKLQDLHIATLEVVAFGKRKINPAAQQSFLLTQELKHIISLEDYCRDWNVNKPNFRHKQKLLAELARITRLMHESGMNHRDCYICHFLLCTKQVEPRLIVIDLHRAQIRIKTPQRWLIKDLAGLYFSTKDIGLTTRDLFRFIKCYTQKSLQVVLRDAKQKTFWDKVKDRGDKLYKQS